MHQKAGEFFSAYDGFVVSVSSVSLSLVSFFSSEFSPVSFSLPPHADMPTWLKSRICGNPQKSPVPREQSKVESKQKFSRSITAGLEAAPKVTKRAHRALLKAPDAHPLDLNVRADCTYVGY